LALENGIILNEVQASGTIDELNRSFNMESSRSKTFGRRFCNIKEEILSIPEAKDLQDKIEDLITFNKVEKFRQWSEKKGITEGNRLWVDSTSVRTKQGAKF